MYHVLIAKIRRDMESEDSMTDLVQDREYSEILLAQTTFVLNLVGESFNDNIFTREVSHLMTIFSKCSQKFDVLPFHGMLQFEKLKLSLSNARDKLKSGENPNSETLEKTFHH